jgi:amidohydrolase
MESIFSELEAQTLLDELSRIAEPAFHEFETTRYIVAYLQKNGIHPESVLKTGCFGTIDCGAEKTIAFRADIDALPTDLNMTEFRHLCGHHAHTAMLLLALKYLNQHKEQLRVNVRYLFQPAEEQGRGALFMLENNCLEGCDEVYGLHVDPQRKIGEILLKPGELMAGAALFDLTFRGRSTHAAYPHTGDDVVAAAGDYMNLCQKIISRFKDPVQKAVLSFAQINGGQACNILPEEIAISGTYRYFDSEVKELIENKMTDIGAAIKLIYGVDVHLSIAKGMPPLLNHRGLTQRLIEIFSATEFQLATEHEPTMGGEDFPFYFDCCPGVFVNLGIADGSGHPPLHNKDFYVPAAAVAPGMTFWVELATHQLMQGEVSS